MQVHLCRCLQEPCCHPPLQQLPHQALLLVLLLLLEPLLLLLLLLRLQLQVEAQA